MQVSIIFDPSSSQDVKEAWNFFRRINNINEGKESPTPNSIKQETVDNGPIEIPTGPVVKHVDTPAQAQAEVKLTIETLRLNTQAKITAGYKDDVAALMKKHGGASLSKIPEENWLAYNTDLLKLGEKS